MPLEFPVGAIRFCQNAAARAWIAGVRVLGRVDLRALFDREFYLRRYPDVAGSGLDPLAHFILYGAREQRQPHPLFDTAGYLAENPDVAMSGMNPLLHYLRYGWKEQRRPNALFDPEWYRAQHPEVAPESNPFLDYVRRRAAGEQVAAAPDWREFLPAVVPRPIPPSPDSPVDVIIPVYRGIAETRACLESVLRADGRRLRDIIVVNDCSPEPELTGYLRRRAPESGLTLIENASNRGFVTSVNRAIELHPDRDVVLLNSDTEVAGDWLDRLAAAAWSAPRIGTATPFSNHATICSYPRFCDYNPMPQNMTTAEMDAVFRKVNAGRLVPIPTAVGFCMYVRRDCLRDTGGFDAAAFGKGYGEENDFCLRAAKHGWQHVLAADVFVYHAGSVSFGQEADLRRTEASQTMRRKHPGYDALVARHISRDPARAYRFAASAWRLRHAGKPVILAISHALGGGVEQHLQELRAAVAGQAELLVLTPLAGGMVLLRNLDPTDDFRIVMDAAQDYPGLLAVLQSCGIVRLHVQHVLGHELDIEKLRLDLNVPFDFTVHDYVTVCPQVNMADGEGRYCGEPDEEGCNRCLAERPPYPLLDIASWRGTYGWLVREADRVLAPSTDTARRMARYFPQRAILTAAHHGTPVAPLVRIGHLGANEPLRIAVAGVMTWQKGLHNLRACTTQARQRHLPLQFVLAGYVEKSVRGKQPFHQTGPYEDARLPELLHEIGAQVIWFPMRSPETFSYTFSACARADLPFVVPAIGAFPERPGGRPWSWIVPWDWDTGQLLEFFVRIRRENFLTATAPEQAGVPQCNAALGSDYYNSKYLAPLQRNPGEGSGLQGSPKAATPECYDGPSSPTI